MPYSFDLAVVGSGPAGEKGAAQAAYFGKRVVVIEKDSEPGGAAVHTGTLPSKTLRDAAVQLAGHRQRDLYGVTVSVAPDLAVQKMIARRLAVRDAEVSRIRWNLGRHHIESRSGFARLVDGHTIEVSGPAGTVETLTAEAVLLATGSRPFHPAEVDFDDPDIDDSDSIIAIERLPERLVVVGSGVIGCEYACTFAELGVRVTIVDRHPELLPFLDREVSDGLAQAMRAAGIALHLGASPDYVGRRDGQLVVDFAGGTVVADRILYAAGRVGCTDGMNLADIGVVLGPRGHVEVDADFRTAVPSVFAAGDVIGFPALASTSMEQGRVAVCRAFGFSYKRRVGASLPYGVYTIPEVSSVGLSEEDARAKGVDIVCGRAPYETNARAIISGASQGFVKLVFDAQTRMLLGAHLLGEGATELVHIGEALLATHGTVDTFIDMVFNYPTLSEAFKYAAYDALGRFPSR